MLSEGWRATMTRSLTWQPRSTWDSSTRKSMRVEGRAMVGGGYHLELEAQRPEAATSRADSNGGASSGALVHPHSVLPRLAALATGLVLAACSRGPAEAPV